MTIRTFDEPLRLLSSWLRHLGHWVSARGMSPSDGLRLVREQLRWRDPGQAFRLGRELRGLGFRPAGEFSIHQLPDVRLAGFVHPIGPAAAVYELGGGGIVVEIFAECPDGRRISVHNGAAANFRACGHGPSQHLPGAGVPELWSRVERGGEARFSRVTRGAFPLLVEASWTHGDPEESEV